MNKLLSLILLPSVIYFSSLNAGILNDKINNIIGKKEFNLHNKLITNLFMDEKKFIIDDNISYPRVFKVLKENGLMNLKLNHPRYIEVKFRTNNNSFKIYKILKHTIQALGFRHVITKSLDLNESNKFTWVVSIKTEYMLDPFLLLKELGQNGCYAINVEKENSTNWVYDLNFENAKIKRAKSIPTFERVIFEKPLRPIIFQTSNTKEIEIISRTLNRWYPHVIFYDNELNVLDIKKQDKVTKKIVINIPNGCNYVIVKDMYNLVNIKRGLTVILR